MANTLNLGNGDWATKENSLLGYNSENGNYKPLPFDFTRASNGTFVNKSGLIETAANGVPRIDFLGNTSGALLLEPQRSNLIPYSSDLTQWFQERVTNTDNETTSPDGYLNASLITEDATLNSKYTYLSPTVTTNEHSLSFFAKYKGRYLQVLFGTNDVSGNPYINFDLQNGTFDNNGVSNPSIEDFGNGWYKCSLTVTSAVTSGFGVLFSIIPSFTSSRLTSYQGDGTSGVYIWGAQLEQGSYATSLINTQGSAVTRVYDTMPNYLDVTPLNIGNSYTLFLDADLNVNDNNKVFSAINNSSDVLSFTIRNNYGGIRLYNHIDGNYPVNGITSTNNKFAIRIDGNSYKVFVQGSSLSGTLTTQRNLGSFNFYGQNTELNINNFTIDNTALSDAECEALVN